MATQLHGTLTERPSGPVVSLAGIRRAFGPQLVLDGIDLQIERGEFVALLGRSGSGKSTLLRGMAGLDDDLEGTISVPARRSVVFQDARLFPWKRVVDNVVVGLGGRTRERGIQALDEVGLAAKAKAWPVTLSGGEAQRVALARALAREPELLLLDEPFGALDALTRIKMHALLQELCRVHTPAVLLVTHDVDEAILLADRVLVLVDGRLAVDQRVELPSPRLRSDPRFGELRTELLTRLGVDEAAEGRRAS